MVLSLIKRIRSFESWYNDRMQHQSVVKRELKRMVMAGKISLIGESNKMHSASTQNTVSISWSSVGQVQANSEIERHRAVCCKLS